MKKIVQNTHFGSILKSLRRQKGLTQKELGKIIGVSLRVISYYERESEFPNTRILIPLAKALQVSTDQLLGLQISTPQLAPERAALWRKLKKVESLPKRDQQAVIHYINALLEKSK